MEDNIVRYLVLSCSPRWGASFGGGDGGQWHGSSGHGRTIPHKLAERIRKWEFIEMFELLPELLADVKVDESRDGQLSRGRGRKRIQDINVWLQCFAVFVGVMAKSFPEAVPGMMG